MGWWLLWLVAIAVSFALLERYALKTNHIPTLSRTVWLASKAWPPLPFVIGVGVGILAAHFWWIGQGCDLVN